MSKVAKLVSRNVSPVHAHDCDYCKFVGRLNGQDLYVCRDDGQVAYSARFGSEGQEYKTLGDMAPPGSPYALAKALFERGGSPNEYRS